MPGVALDSKIIDTFINPRIDRVRTYLDHQWSISAQDQVSVADGRFQVVGGVRYDNYTTQTNDRLSGEDGPVGRGDNVTYKFGAIYDILRGLTAYYNYSETFSPSFGAQPDGTQFEPLAGTIHEVGLKSSLMDGRISGTLAAFEIEQTNIIQNDPDPLRAAAGWRVQSALNRVEGVELDLAANLTPNWELMLSGSVLSIYQPNGLVPRGVPNETAAAWTRYSFDGGAMKGLTLGGGVSWIGPTPLESGNDYLGQDTATADVFARYNWKNYSFQLNVTNLTDERYLQRGVNRTILFHGPVRLIKFSMHYSF
jgi:iron complex outermembrane receptor protein